MVGSKAADVDAFLRQAPVERRAILEKIRLAIRTEVPGALETMEHGMPTYRRGRSYWGFQAQKNYYAVYFSPENLDVVARIAKKHPNLDCGKSCVRFRSFEQLSLSDLRVALRSSAR